MISNWRSKGWGKNAKQKEKEHWNIRQDQAEEWLVSVGIAHKFLAGSNQPPPHDEIPNRLAPGPAVPETTGARVDNGLGKQRARKPGKCGQTLEIRGLHSSLIWFYMWFYMV